MNEDLVRQSNDGIRALLLYLNRILLHDVGKMLTV